VVHVAVKWRGGIYGSDPAVLQDVLQSVLQYIAVFVVACCSVCCSVCCSAAADETPLRSNM